MDEKEIQPKEIIDEKKKCFVVTPIGNINDEIRRHADGVIDAVLEPILEEFNYEVIVAHRINKTGSINKQVINGIFNADLVIANLTGLNANVMYELAFSHSIGKPTIMIAEDGVTKLPFDISTERTLFYKNDIKGSIELKKSLTDVLNELSITEKNDDLIDNPIYSWLNTSIYEKTIVNKLKNNKIDKDINAFEYILQRLDNMQARDSLEVKSNMVDNNGKIYKTYRINLNEGQGEDYVIFIKDEIKKRISEYKENIKLYGMSYRHSGKYVDYKFKYRNIDEDKLDEIIWNILDKCREMFDKKNINNI